jgi:hypothetical protein
MRKRQILWIGGAVVLVALAFLLTDQLLTPSPGVTKANVRRIRAGMTLQEVEAIFGEPVTVVQHGGFTHKRTTGLWLTGAVHVMLLFNDEMRVETVLDVRSTREPTERNFLERLWSWLGW